MLDIHLWDISFKNIMSILIITHNLQVISMLGSSPFRLLPVLYPGLCANNDSVKSLRNMFHVVLGH